MKVALAIPTIRPNRVAHVAALQIGADYSCILSDREPNYIWAEKMRAWWLSTDADWLVTLQDDSEVCPRFFDVIRAQLENLPPRAVLGLSSVHPIQSEIYRQGHRWYRTRAWICGWGWGISRADLRRFDAWCLANDARVRKTNEDSLFNEWCIESERDVFHPVPATVDHDTSLDSTYNNDHHVHRRPFITWRDTDSDLTRPEYWRMSGEAPMLPMPSPRHCWWCLKNPAFVATTQTGAAMCQKCLMHLVEGAVMR